MSYKHIDNLYKAQEILLFRECYAMEKIHGSSSHVIWHVNNNELGFFAGGEKHVNFVKCFNKDELKERFTALGQPDVIVYGEAYGGKCQGMSDTYGKELKFIAFEVKVGESWLSVRQAEEVVESLGLEFVHYRIIDATIDALDAEILLPSVQAQRNGCGTDKKREGIVLRPLMELTMNNGKRIVAKHKREDFKERKHVPKVGDQIKIMGDARKVADEWVTYTRLQHVLDKLGNPSDITKTGDVVKAMVEDVCREAEGEIIDNQATRRAIANLAARLYKDKIVKTMRNK
ncbi:RNA ligase family protein [Verrucomicrobiota bacterium]